MILYLNCDVGEEQTFTKRDYLFKAAQRLKFMTQKDVSTSLGALDEKSLIWVLPYQAGTVAEYVLNIEPFGTFVTGTKWTGVWEIDIILDRREMSDSNWAASNMVFLSNAFLPSRLENYQGPKTVLFQACDPDIHRRIPTIPQEYDLVFAGTMAGLDVYRERERLYQVMRKHFTFESFGKAHRPVKYNEYLNQGRVQFVRSGCNQIQTSQVEQRFFECLAIGPVLKDYHPSLENLGLVEGEDFLWYKNDEEMLLKMHYLIDNPGLAKLMAEKGRKKALTYHTYDNRLTTIMNFIREAERE